MPVPVWEGIAKQLALLSHHPNGSVRPHLAGDVHAYVRVLGVSLVVVGRDRNFRNWVPIKAELRDGSVLMKQRWLQLVHKLLTMHQTRLCGASIDQVRGFGTLQEVQRRGQWKALSSSGTRYDKSSRLAATTTLSRAHAETSWKHSCNVQRLANA